MDFIKQLIAFDKKSSGNLPPVAVAIYLKLFMLNNERGRGEWFEESDFWLGRAVGIKRRETIVSALNVLKQKGFIEFERGGAHKMSRYHIIELSTSYPHPLNISANNSANNVFPLINSKKKSKSESESDTRARATPKFTPPTLDDVNQYILEKNLHVSAKKFWEYYDAGSWKDGKGNPVKNWKQKLLTWEAHEPKQSTSSRADIADRAIEMAEQLDRGGGIW